MCRNVSKVGWFLTIRGRRKHNRKPDFTAQTPGMFDQGPGIPGQALGEITVDIARCQVFGGRPFGQGRL
jgi:hypothetical protein